MVLAVALTGLSACSTLPKSPDKPVTMGRPPVSHGLLAETSRAVLANAGENESAFLLINHNTDALRWRLALIDHAQDSIDLQVFIWSDDVSGRLIWRRLYAASQRGVRIRLLLDDMPKDWSDRSTALIGQHSDDIHVRRFNPGRVRTGVIGRTLQMSTQFRTLNRRMHNKQMIVDGQWAIIGGRNIGNPYFGLSPKYNNRDLDLLITGELTRELVGDFDEYWNSEAAYPGEAMHKPISERKARKISREFAELHQEDRAFLAPTSIPIDRIDWQEWFAPLPARMEPGSADVVQDSPIVKGDRGPRLIDKIPALNINPSFESCIISPYLIPSKSQLEDIRRAAQDENRRIRLLTPSMESNNHTMAHSHYRKYRKPLLERGAELYEFRGQPSEALRAYSDTPPIRAKFISLHAKAFILDQRWVVIGSLNLDPRSIKINTEHMVFIDSPNLAAELMEDFERLVDPANSWVVSQDDRGTLRWDSDTETRTRQPARSFLQRCQDVLYRWLPIEGQL